MACQGVRDRLTPFIDDELDPVASREVQEHLKTCADCSAELTRLRETSERLHRDITYHRAPDLLRARILHQTRAASRPEAGARSWLAHRAWLSAAATILVVAGGVWVVALMSGGAGDAALTREAVAAHVRSLMADHLTDVASTDQHTVKPWFAGKLDFSPPVTDFAAAGYPLEGGRLDYLQGRAVAALVYGRHKHVINVFVWPVTGRSRAIAPTETRQGFHVIHGTGAGMAFWMVSDLNAEELAGFARLLIAPPGDPGSPR
jgi:anti-sigma factor RsiW